MGAKLIQSDLEVSEELKELLEKAKDHVMTTEEYEEQRISFAYGNLALSNPDVTKEQIRAAAKDPRLFPEGRRG